MYYGKRLKDYRERINSIIYCSSMAGESEKFKSRESEISGER